MEVERDGGGAGRRCGGTAVWWDGGDSNGGGSGVHARGGASFYKRQDVSKLQM
jgi:hypothetical protein